MPCSDRSRKTQSTIARVSSVVLLALAAWASPAVAIAKPKAKVEIASVDWKGAEEATPDRARRLRASVRRIAYESAKRLDFGVDGKVELGLLVKELTFTEEADGVLRISCVVVGRLKGVGSARSKLSFGGRPDQKKKLERQALSSVIDGVMVRLADMSRAEAKRKKAEETAASQ